MSLPDTATDDQRIPRTYDDLFDLGSASTQWWKDYSTAVGRLGPDALNPQNAMEKALHRLHKCRFIIPPQNTHASRPKSTKLADFRKSQLSNRSLPLLKIFAITFSDVENQEEGVLGDSARFKTTAYGWERFKSNLRAHVVHTWYYTKAGPDGTIYTDCRPGYEEETVWKKFTEDLKMIRKRIDDAGNHLMVKSTYYQPEAKYASYGKEIVGYDDSAVNGDWMSEATRMENVISKTHFLKDALRTQGMEEHDAMYKFMTEMGLFQPNETLGYQVKRSRESEDTAYHEAQEGLQSLLDMCKREKDALNHLINTAKPSSLGTRVAWLRKIGDDFNFGLLMEAQDWIKRGDEVIASLDLLVDQGLFLNIS